MSKKISIAALLGFWLSAAQIVAGAAHETSEYRTEKLAFRYPSDFKLSTKDHGSTIQLAWQSGSKYWQDTISIRRHNKKRDECDFPQDCQPDLNDQRKIAGRPTHAYSGEDAAMNRFTKVKGYIIETRDSCWGFELIRTGKPYQKFDLSRQEVRRLDKQSQIDSRRAQSAFDVVLNTFVLAR